LELEGWAQKVAAMLDKQLANDIHSTKEDFLELLHGFYAGC
jgi:hypothetical protein